jgi:hypothetical protein
MLRLVLRVAEERINKANDILKNISLGSCGAGVVVDEISVRVVVVVSTEVWGSEPAFVAWDRIHVGFSDPRTLCVLFLSSSV